MGLIAIRNLGLAIAFIVSGATWAQSPSPHEQEAAATLIMTGSYQDYIRKGRQAYEDARYSDAVTYLQHALSVNPRSVVAVELLVRAYSGLGQYDQAVNLLVRSSEQIPHEPRLDFLLAEVYLSLGLVGESVILLEKLIAQDPTPHFYYTTLARAYIDDHRYKMAIRILDRGILRSGQYIEIFELKAFCQMMLRNYDEALETLDYALAIYQGESREDLLIIKAKVLYRLGSNFYKQAVDLLNQLISKNPQSPKAYDVLVDVYIAQQKFDKGFEVLEWARKNQVDEGWITAKYRVLENLRLDNVKFAIEHKASGWLDENQEYWADFYLTGVWHISESRRLVLGVDSFVRPNDVVDFLLHIRYVQELGRWVYVYTDLRLGIDTQLRETASSLFGVGWTLNPFSMGSSHLGAEVEGRFFEEETLLIISVSAGQQLPFNLSLQGVFDILISEQEANAFLYTLRLEYRPGEAFYLFSFAGNAVERIDGVAEPGLSVGGGVGFRFGPRLRLGLNYNWQRTNDGHNRHRAGLYVRFSIPPRKN